MNPFDPMSFEPVPPSPLSDLLKTSFGPTPLPSFEVPHWLATPPQFPTLSPLSDLLKTSLGPTPLPSFEVPDWLATPPQLPTLSPLSDLLKTSLDPTPLPSLEVPEWLGPPPQLPTLSPLSDLLKTSLEPTPLPLFEVPEWLGPLPQLPTLSPLSDLLTTSLGPTLLPSFQVPDWLATPPQLPTQSPLSDLLIASLPPVPPVPLLSDLLKTSFEPTPLPPFTVDPVIPHIDSRPGPLQFSAFDSTKVGPFPPLVEMLTKPHDSLKLVLKNLDSTLPPIGSVEASGLTDLTGALMSDWANTVGSINPSKVSPLLQDFHQASSNYSAFLSSIPAGLFDPLSLRLPARGYFESADALIEIDQGPGFDLRLHRKRELTRTNLETRTRATLEAALAKINPSLCKLWHGANLAAISDNPDKARHALTSLRELFTQVIHHLAPDAKVKKWTSDPAKYHNGRPTREARLLFICSPIATPPMSDFIKADVRSVLSLAQVFQQGTHDIDLSLSPSQLRLIFLRVEGALCALIETGLAEL